MAERIDTVVGVRGAELALDYLTDERGDPVEEEGEDGFARRVVDFAAFEVALTLRQPGANGSCGPPRAATMRLRADAARRLHALLGVAIHEHDIDRGFAQAELASRPACSHGEYDYTSSGTKVCRKCGR